LINGFSLALRNAAEEMDLAGFFIYSSPHVQSPRLFRVQQARCSQFVQFMFAFTDFGILNRCGKS